MSGAIGRTAQVLSPRGGIRVRQQIQMLGFYLAGFLCLVLSVLKLTIEGHCYSPRIERLPLRTIPDQNTSWHTTLRTPDPNISSNVEHRAGMMDSTSFLTLRERELIQIVVEVLMTDRSLVGSHQPP